MELVPLAHPAYILRNHTYLDTWKSHWAVVKNLLVPTDDAVTKVGAEILDRVEVPE